ncbi:jg3152 [Pararge aegeria aegeria]|uniref:Jg3152 protein n=1 Tax=Pararge aegeria aegeria TaxID=348720 RepID=A0A8S4QJI3_9NEOP|nr:jg3152 [Pararge aegeria aegeria]
MRLALCRLIASAAIISVATAMAAKNDKHPATEQYLCSSHKHFPVMGNKPMAINLDLDSPSSSYLYVYNKIVLRRYLALTRSIQGLKCKRETNERQRGTVGLAFDICLSPT